MDFSHLGDRGWCVLLRGRDSNLACLSEPQEAEGGITLRCFGYALGMILKQGSLVCGQWRAGRAAVPRYGEPDINSGDLEAMDIMTPIRA